MADDLGDKTEDPTSRKREEARKKGQVPRSANLSAALLLTGGVVILFYFGANIIKGSFVLIQRFLEPATLASDIRGDRLIADIVFASGVGIRILAPILILMFFVALIDQIFQVGFFLSAEAIRPKISRFNPLAGIKRLFSKRTLVKGVLDILKLAVLATIGFTVISMQFDRIVALPMLSVPGILVMIAELALELAKWTLLALIILGVADRVYQKWQHTQDLRMTKQEVKDERKSTEGDAEAKARRMRFARDIIQQRLGASVPQADVIVTNPTHYSVAIKYDADTMQSPRVVAKGADYIALQIRILASSHGIPIVERPPLARALYASVDVGRSIPVEHFEAVAELLAYVYRLEGRLAS